MKKFSSKLFKVFLLCLLISTIIFIKEFYFKEYPIGNDKIPYYSQRDKRWANELYGKTDTIKRAGCGPTCLAMVISGLTGQKDITPKVIADWSVENGHRAEGNGSYWSLMTGGADAFGLKAEQISRKKTKEILQALQEGKVIIVSLDEGKIASGGHFIVLRGITKEGKILIYDPDSVSNSKKEWDSNVVFNESSKNGGENGTPFWIFDKK